MSSRPGVVARTGLAVVGPTAVGKSDLAVALARRLGGEVVNADSMQLYRGMDIGTAKLTMAERAGVAHHLLDVLDVRQDANVAAYQEQALAVVADIRRRGKVPVLVGGSGLYVAAVVSGLAFPGTDAVIRARLEDELAAEGAPALHAMLTAVDPEAAAAILPSNGRKLVRALEVVELTGGPFRAVLPELGADGPGSWLRIGVTAPRPDLAARIGARVDRMWALGLVDEVRRLAAEGLREGRTAARALGYAQVLRHLAGVSSEERARVDTVNATRRFVRRQESWFGRDPSIRWLPYDAPDLLDQALAHWIDQD
ncbi:MAG TPA: tRNA (adenosine(37)-N6)-dimethylallyltransferase MiaA [Actinomycetes bacterium]